MSATQSAAGQNQLPALSVASAQLRHSCSPIRVICMLLNGKQNASIRHCQSGAEAALQLWLAMGAFKTPQRSREIACYSIDWATDCARYHWPTDVWTSISMVRADQYDACIVLVKLSCIAALAIAWALKKHKQMLLITSTPPSLMQPRQHLQMLSRVRMLHCAAH